MADIKISALPASAGLATPDLFAVVDDPGGTPATQKATVAQLITLLNTLYAPVTGGAYVLKSGDTMTGLLTIAQGTANTSALVVTGYSLTGANTQSLLDLAGTWNTSGNPSAIMLDITYTASGAASRLLNLKVDGVSVFSVDRVGGVIGLSTFKTNDVLVEVGGVPKTQMYGPTPGTYISSDWRFLWSSTTDSNGASDLGWGRNSAGVMEINSSVMGTFRDLWARTLRTATAFTVATLPAAGTAGRRAYVTDATAPTFLGALIGGGAVVTPVFDNGAAWVSA